MRVQYTLTAILAINFGFAQISLGPETSLIEKPQFNSALNSMFSSDLNNDGFEDLATISSNDNAVMWYKNVNGDLQGESARIITSSLEYPTSIYCADIDGDGLIDIAVTSYVNKIAWFKNLGNDNFSSEIIISTSLTIPQHLELGDVNNDGFPDIVACGAEEIRVYFNDSNNSFTDSQTLQNSTNGFKTVKLFDHDDNNTVDVFSIRGDGDIFLIKNLGNSSFAGSTMLTSSSSYSSDIGFLDVNNDNYLDLIFSNSDNILSYKLSQNGLSFGNVTIINSAISPRFIAIKDVDNNGVSDIVVADLNSLIWLKKNSGNSFSTNSVSADMSGILDVKVFDANNDGINELISSGSTTITSPATWRLSYFFKTSQSTTQYQQKIINIYLGAIRSVRIADLDNDGLNDIVSGYRNVVWNKNTGNGNFSSFKLINNQIGTVFAYNIEIADLNNDGLLDIVATKVGKFEVYQNMGNGNFSLAFSQALDHQSRDIELADIDEDGDSDILLTFITGDTWLGKIVNNGNFSFGPISPLTFPNSYYMPYKISCGDIDNDNDMDIIVNSKDTGSLQWLINTGAGVFNYQNVIVDFSADSILLADMDNDSFLDIVTAANYELGQTGVFWIRNNNGVFMTPSVIDGPQGLSSIAIDDLDGDGYKDVVGVSYESFPPYDEKLITYQNNGGSFLKTIADTLGETLSSARDVSIGDLNNDSKPDVATSYYFIGKLGYYLNDSPLTIVNDLYNTNDLTLYPNPTSGKVYWNDLNGLVYNIKLYNVRGQLLKDLNTPQAEIKMIDLDNLEAGIYYIVFKNSEKEYFRKIIKN